MLKEYFEFLELLLLPHAPRAVPVSGVGVMAGEGGEGGVMVGEGCDGWGGV